MNNSNTPQVEWWKEYLEQLDWHTMVVPVLGEVLINENKAINLLLKEQKRRDLEEFKQFIHRLRFVANVEDESQKVAKQIMDKALDYYKERIEKMIDAKLSEIK